MISSSEEYCEKKFLRTRQQLSFLIRLQLGYVLLAYLIYFSKSQENNKNTTTDKRRGEILNEKMYALITVFALEIETDRKKTK